MLFGKYRLVDYFPALPPESVTHKPGAPQITFDQAGDYQLENRFTGDDHCGEQSSRGTSRFGPKSWSSVSDQRTEPDHGNRRRRNNQSH